MAGFDEIFEKDNRDKLVYAVLFTYIVITYFVLIETYLLRYLMYDLCK
jgi:hypothetical protein